MRLNGANVGVRKGTVEHGWGLGTASTSCLYKATEHYGTCKTGPLHKYVVVFNVDTSDNLLFPKMPKILALGANQESDVTLLSSK